MYPVSFELEGKNCIVIGAGKISCRRTAALLNAGAQVTVISPEKCPEEMAGKNISYIQKCYDKSDLKGCFLVIAATNDSNLNEQIVADSKFLGIPVSSVTKCTDNQPDMKIPSVSSGNGITVAVSTDGKSPALAAELSREINNYMERYNGLCELQQNIREELRSKNLTSGERYEIMRAVSSEAMRALYYIGGNKPYLEMAEKICSQEIVHANRKKAILVISFGTSYENTREKTIGAVENAVRGAFPEADVYRAFTSGMIIRKMKNEGIYTDTVAEALAKLSLMGYTEVYCQPTHVMPGEEYDDLCRDASAFSKAFSVLKTGRPLLTDTEDFSALISALEPELQSDSETAVVFMGHGTEHPSNTVYPALNYHFYQRGFRNVMIGTVEGYPEFDDIIRQLEKNKYKKVILFPLMVAAGDHVQNDMAGDNRDSWKSVLEAKGFDVEVRLKGLGEYPAVQKLYVSHLSEIFNGN